MSSPKRGGKKYSISQARQTPQSMDVTLQARVEPRIADKVKAVCFDNGICLSDFLRDAVSVGQVYAPFVEVLIEEQDTIIPLLKRLSKRR